MPSTAWQESGKTELPSALILISYPHFSISGEKTAISHSSAAGHNRRDESARLLWSGSDKTEVKVGQLALSKGQRANLDVQDLKLSKQGSAEQLKGTIGWWPSYRCRGKLPKWEQAAHVTQMLTQKRYRLGGWKQGTGLWEVTEALSRAMPGDTESNRDWVRPQLELRVMWKPIWAPALWLQWDDSHGSLEGQMRSTTRMLCVVRH